MPDFTAEYWQVLLGVAVMLLVWWRLSQKPITLQLSERTTVNAWEPPLLSDVSPALAEEIHTLLLGQDEFELAGQVSELRIVDRCRCADDFCGTFYVRPKPKGDYGPKHRNVVLEPKEGMLASPRCS
jgi:hypothetical protein